MQKQKNQSVQCTFPNSFTNIYKNKNAKEFSSTKSNTINKNKDDLECYSKIDDQSKFYHFILFYFTYFNFNIVIINLSIYSSFKVILHIS